MVVRFGGVRVDGRMNGWNDGWKEREGGRERWWMGGVSVGWLAGYWDWLCTLTRTASHSPSPLSHSIPPSLHPHPHSLLFSILIHAHPHSPTLSACSGCLSVVVWMGVLVGLGLRGCMVGCAASDCLVPRTMTPCLVAGADGCVCGWAAVCVWCVWLVVCVCSVHRVGLG